MRPTMTIDTTQWRKASRDLFETSKRSLPDFLNGQALAVASRALKLTVQASQARIELELGQIANEIKQRTRGKNVGKYYNAGRVLKEDSLAERIVAKRYNETGKWIAEGATLADRAKRLIAKRVSTISLVRSGWIPALRTLTSIVRNKPKRSSTSVGGAKQIGKDKGRAKPARWRPGAIFTDIINDIPALYRGTNDEAEAGLQKALDESARDMRETLAARLKKDLAKFGAR